MSSYKQVIQDKFDGNAAMSKIKFPNKNIKLIQSVNGVKHILVLDSNGDVWSYLNPVTSADMESYPELGAERNKVILFKPLKVLGLPKIKKICCGASHSLCLDINDNLWGFGYNQHSQLAETEDIEIYIPIVIKKNVLDVFSGPESKTTFILLKNNVIKVVGNNRYGQCGINSNGNEIENFTIVKTLRGKGKILKIISYAFRSIAIFENGNVFKCGSTSGGKEGEFSKWNLGIKVRGITNVYIPTPILLSKDGKIYAYTDKLVLIDASNRLLNIGNNNYHFDIKIIIVRDIYDDKKLVINLIFMKKHDRKKKILVGKE